MAELEAEKAALEESLAAATEAPKIRLHPNLAGLYRDKVAALEQALADPAIKAEAAEIIRSQIERITLTPNKEGGLEVQLYGDIAQILQFCEAGEHKNTTPRPSWTGTSIVGGCRGLATTYGPSRLKTDLVVDDDLGRALGLGTELVPLRHQAASASVNARNAGRTPDQPPFLNEAATSPKSDVDAGAPCPIFGSV